MKVEMQPIDSIQPYEKNPRHNDAGVDMVAKSIDETESSSLATQDTKLR
jgi:hypothetical protein